MIPGLGRVIRRSVGILGYSIIPLPERNKMIEKEFGQVYQKCRNYTMTSVERMYALYTSVGYIVDNDIPGDLVECGVWRGGSIMVMAYALLKKGDVSRRLYLYDTFTGMPRPSGTDLALPDSSRVLETWSTRQRKDHNEWAFSSLSEVKKNVFSTGYPPGQIEFVKGKVEDTIPNTVPERISLLRLDTDWYESTKHELKHLFPLMQKKGVVIIDDYGSWGGSKAAVDDFLMDNRNPLFLAPLDLEARIAVV